jgi:hypothetical protein
MPVTGYLVPSVGQGFDGMVLLAKNNGGVPGTVYAFPTSLVAPAKSNNSSYPAMTDGSANAHNKVRGKREGRLRLTCALPLDRGVAAFLADAHGPTGRSDFFADVVPFAGAGTQMYNLVYIDQTILYGRDGVRGQDAMWMLDIQASVTDPDNAINTRAGLAVPASVGSNGLGLSTFPGSTLTNSAVTPVSYDVLNAISATFLNRNARIPGTIPGTRYGPGFKRGQFIGALTVGQTYGAANPVPAGGAEYPFTLIIPTGDGSKSLTLALSASDDDAGLQIAPTSFVAGSETYTLFGSNAGNATATANGGAGWPFVATYA